MTTEPDFLPLEAARRFAVGRPTGRPPVLRPRGIINIAEWTERPAPARRWLVPDLIPSRNVTMVSGNGGDGKSLLLLQLMVSTALGRPWLGRAIAEPGPVIGVFAEDEPDELHRRVEGIAEADGLDLCDLVPRMTILSRVGEDNGLIAYGPHGVMGHRECEFLTQLENLCHDLGPSLLVLDPLHALFTGNENDREQAFHFIGRLRRIALDADCTVVLCAHPSRAGMSIGSGDSGSTGWHNSVRARLYLTRDEDDRDGRILGARKSNYGPMEDDIRMRWESGRFVPLVSDLGGTVGSIERRSRDRAAEAAFLACLDMTAEQGRHVTEATNSPRYAPRVFSGMPKGKGFKVDDLAQAMERLFATGTIRVGLAGRYANRSPIQGIVRAGAEGREDA